MKKLSILSLLGFVLFILSCGTTVTDKEIQQMADSIRIADSLSMKKSSSSTSAIQNALEKKVDYWIGISNRDLPELLKKFTLEEDKIEGGGWYIHKNKKNKFKNHLEVPVSTNGYFYLKTNYCGDDWIFHDQIVANITGISLYSSIEEGFSDYNVRNNNANFVFESCHLSSPLKDGYIVMAIASNYDKEISIRFKGDQKSKDIILSEEDKIIITECFKLSQCLTVSKNQYSQIIVLDERNPEQYSYIVPEGNYPTAEIKKTN